MIHRLTLFAAALMLAACQPAAESQAEAAPPVAPEAPVEGFSPADLAAMISADGPEATIAALFETPGDARWTAFVDGLSAGDQAWIDNAVTLKAWTDGEASESLWSGLAEGLEHNAAGVLRAADIDGRELVCYRADPEADPDADGFNARRTAAVQAVTDPDLATIREECLAQLSGEAE